MRVAGEGARDSALVVDRMMPVDERKSRLSLLDLPPEGSYRTLAGLVLARCVGRAHPAGGSC